jgi:glucuronoarabinoxylan endo-1,4-beta-xylanase
VSLKLFNTLGQEVAELLNEDRPAGVHTVQFDAAGLPSGVYLYRLTAGSFVQTRKMLIVK